MQNINSNYRDQTFKSKTLITKNSRKDLKKSTKNEKKLYEKTDKDKILRLIASPLLLIEEKNTLHKYKQRISNNCVAVKYYFSKGCNNFGRLYAEGSISLQNFRKEIRHTLAKNIYDEIDMVNAHPTLLSQYCEKNNIECIFLKDYVDNREIWLNEIIDFHNISRNCAKKLVLKLCYLGNYVIEEEENFHRCFICYEIQKTVNVKNIKVCESCFSKCKKFGGNIESCLIDLYYEHYNLNYDAELTLEVLEEIVNDIFPIELDKKLPKLIDFAKELKFIATLISRIETDIFDIVEKDDTKTHKISSILSMTAQVIEHNCLMSMNKFFDVNGFKVGVYCFDGLMVEKENGKKITDDLLKECSNYVKKETGYIIKLEVKPMDRDIDISELSEFVDEDKDVLREYEASASYLRSTREVQEKLFILENPDYFRFCQGNLYVFNENTGMYETNIEALNYYIVKHQKYFKKEIIIGKDRIIIKNYGRDANLMTKVLPFVKLSSKANDWIENTSQTSLGYLLFKNGIYNMEKGTFTKGFNSSIVFHKRISSFFPRKK